MQLGKIHIFLTGICMYTELSVVVVVFFFFVPWVSDFFFFFFTSMFIFSFFCLYILYLSVVCSSIPPSFFPFFALSHDFLFFFLISELLSFSSPTIFLYPFMKSSFPLSL